MLQNKVCWYKSVYFNDFCNLKRLLCNYYGTLYVLNVVWWVTPQRVISYDGSNSTYDITWRAVIVLLYLIFLHMPIYLFYLFITLITDTKSSVGDMYLDLKYVFRIVYIYTCSGFKFLSIWIQLGVFVIIKNIQIS